MGVCAVCCSRRLCVFFLSWVWVCVPACVFSPPRVRTACASCVKHALITKPNQDKKKMAVPRKEMEKDGER